MTFTNAVAKLEKEGYQMEVDYNGIIATKPDFRSVEIQRNGREDQVGSIKVSNSYPKTLKRALELSATLGK